MFFVRSGIAGYVYSGGSWGAGNALATPGVNALYWSRSSSSSTLAFSLYFNSPDVYPSNYWTRYYGFSLRCLYPHVK